jgi:hypothetical protein
MNLIDLAPGRDRLRAYVNMDSNEPSDSVNGQKFFDCLRAGLASQEGFYSMWLVCQLICPLWSDHVQTFMEEN